jgi:hypothetical protein
MKNIYLLLLSLCIVTFSCKEEDDTMMETEMQNNETSNVFNEQIISGLLFINDVNIVPEMGSPSSEILIEQVDAQTLPFGFFETFEVSFFVPLDNTVNLEVSHNDAYVEVLDGATLGMTFQEINVVEDFTGNDGVLRRHFTLKYTYDNNNNNQPTNDATAASLNGFGFKINAKYTNAITGENAAFKNYEYRINLYNQGPPVGSVIFWTSEDLGCGPITISISGLGSRVITGSWNSVPSCDQDQAGGLFKDVQAGNYSYFAECNGYFWSDNITISAGSCRRVRFLL